MQLALRKKNTIFSNSLTRIEAAIHEISYITENPFVNFLNFLYNDIQFDKINFCFSFFVAFTISYNIFFNSNQ